ncbi:MAG: hypothetical protein CL760_11360 [Chloroflexi bacterium]|nr:hypothetical protein [Chloroflexota bacterium]|tara:strand:+ start:20581 stop:22083 length:1503 start_codon:yes stop_codon:yes gene_type:complete
MSKTIFSDIVHALKKRDKQVKNANDSFINEYPTETKDEMVLRMLSENAKIKTLKKEETKKKFLFKNAASASLDYQYHAYTILHISKFLGLDYNEIDIFAIITAFSTSQYDYSAINPEAVNNLTNYNSGIDDDYFSRDQYLKHKYLPLALAAPKETYDVLYKELSKSTHCLSKSNYVYLHLLRNFFSDEQIDKALEKREYASKERYGHYISDSTPEERIQERIKSHLKYKENNHDSKKVKFQDLNENKWLFNIQQRLENRISSVRGSTFKPNSISDVTIQYRDKIKNKDGFIYKDVVLFDSNTLRLIAFSQELLLDMDIFKYMKAQFSGTTYVVRKTNKINNKTCSYHIEKNATMNAFDRFCDIVSDNKKNKARYVQDLSFDRTMNVSENKFRITLYGQEIPHKANEDLHFKKHISEIEKIGNFELIKTESHLGLGSRGTIYTIDVILNSAARIKNQCDVFEKELNIETKEIKRKEEEEIKKRNEMKMKRRNELSRQYHSR